MCVGVNSLVGQVDPNSRDLYLDGAVVDLLVGNTQRLLESSHQMARLEVRGIETMSGRD